MFSLDIVQSVLHHNQLLRNAFQLWAHNAGLPSTFGPFLCNKSSFLPFKVLRLLFKFLSKLIDIRFIFADLFERQRKKKNEKQTQLQGVKFI